MVLSIFHSVAELAREGKRLRWKDEKRNMQVLLSPLKPLKRMIAQK